MFFRNIIVRIFEYNHKTFDFCIYHFVLIKLEINASRINFFNCNYFFWFFFSLIFVIPKNTVFIYLIYNLNDKVGIQGDSGSFFRVLFLVISSKIFNNNEFYFIFLFLSPIWFDIIATTLVRLFSNENIFIGHKITFIKVCSIKISYKINPTVCLFTNFSVNYNYMSIRNFDQNYLFIVLLYFRYKILIFNFIIFNSKQKFRIRLNN